MRQNLLTIAENDTSGSQLARILLPNDPFISIPSPPLNGLELEEFAQNVITR